MYDKVFGLCIQVPDRKCMPGLLTIGHIRTDVKNDVIRH